MAAVTTIQGPVAGTKAWEVWTGRVLSGLPVLLMLFSASMKLSYGAAFVETWTKTFGFQESALTPVGILEVLCVAVYLVPRTAVLGAILLAAYLGGAVVTHVRVGDPFVIPIVLGVFVWAGLYLRDRRLRALLPLRAPSKT